MGLGSSPAAAVAAQFSLASSALRCISSQFLVENRGYAYLMNLIRPTHFTALSVSHFLDTRALGLVCSVFVVCSYFDWIYCAPSVLALADGFPGSGFCRPQIADVWVGLCVTVLVEVVLLVRHRDYCDVLGYVYLIICSHAMSRVVSSTFHFWFRSIGPLGAGMGGIHICQGWIRYCAGLLHLVNGFGLNGREG